MGRASSTLRRTAQNFNVENRAHKRLEQQAKKPERAPRHASTEQILKDYASKHPEILEIQKKKDDILLTKMKHMALDSIGDNPEIRAKAQSRLPENRGKVEDPEFGYLEPDIIPPGKASIRQALEFISSHQAQPEVYDAKTIAMDYKLESAQVQQVLKYFKAYEMYLPKALRESYPKLDNLVKMESMRAIGPQTMKKYIPPGETVNNK